MFGSIKVEKHVPDRIGAEAEADLLADDDALANELETQRDPSSAGHARGQPRAQGKRASHHFQPAVGETGQQISLAQVHRARLNVSLFSTAIYRVATGH
jgi:hypothetical protein